MNWLKKYCSWLWNGTRGMRMVLCLNVLLGMLGAGLGLAFIFLCKRTVDLACGQDSGNGPGLVGMAVLMSAAMLLRIICTIWNSRIESISRSRMSFRLRESLFHNLMSMRWTGKSKLHSGDALNRLMTDVDTVSQIICTELPSAVSTFFLLAAAFCFMAVLQWKLALVILLATPAMILLSKVFFRKVRALNKGIRQDESLIQGHMQESLQHFLTIRSLESEDNVKEQLGSYQSGEMDKVLSRTRLNVISRLIVNCAFSGGYILAFLWGVFGIHHGAVTFGMMTAFLQLVGQIQGPASRLMRQLPSFVNATTSIDRLIEIGIEPMEDKAEAQLLEGSAGVRISNLRFAYPDADAPVYQNFSHDFTPGSRTAIVGETGAGKSTLIRLMLALLRPDDGKVEIYDANGACLKASSATRCNIAYVPQGNTLLSGTIRENLLLGRPDADEAQMREALHIAAADFVFDLSDGLDTVAGERGEGLSEGQAQRIAIARGLLRRGSILLLDEFSSSLDEATEKTLIDNLMQSESLRSRTMIFITHRPAVTSLCTDVLHIR